MVSVAEQIKSTVLWLPSIALEIRLSKIYFSHQELSYLCLPPSQVEHDPSSMTRFGMLS